MKVGGRREDGIPPHLAQRVDPVPRYRGCVAPRSRILAFGSAAALVVAGVICAIFVAGLTGEIVASALVTVGLGAVILLLFFEVGLSEDREMAKEEERQRERARGSRRPRSRPSIIRPRRRD